MALAIALILWLKRESPYVLLWLCQLLTARWIVLEPLGNLAKEA